MVLARRAKESDREQHLCRSFYLCNAGRAILSLQLPASAVAALSYASDIHGQQTSFLLTRAHRRSAAHNRCNTFHAFANRHQSGRCAHTTTPGGVSEKDPAPVKDPGPVSNRVPGGVPPLPRSRNDMQGGHSVTQRNC